MLWRLQCLYAGLYAILTRCTYLMCTAYLSGGCSPCPVSYTGSRRPNLAVARVFITYALSRTLLRQQGISHLSLSRVMRGHLLSLVARVCRCAAARYGFVCTAAALDIRSGTAPGLGCGVNTSGRRFGSARPAWLAAWRSCARLVALLPAVAVAVAVFVALLLGALPLVGCLARACCLRRARGSPQFWSVG